MIEVLIAFIGMALVDLVFAFYVIKAAEGKAYTTGTYAVLLTFLNGMVTLAYVDNKLMLIPAALGAFVGTVMAIKLDQRKKLQNV